MKISFKAPELPKSGALALFTASASKLEGLAEEVDAATGGALSRALKANRFGGEQGEIVELLAPHGIAASRVMLVGLGKPNQLAVHDYETLGASIMARLISSGEKQVSVMLDRELSKPPAAEAAAGVAAGLRLRRYRFDRYRTKEPKKKKPTLDKAVIGTPQHKEAKALFAEFEPVIDAVSLTRDLTSEPANVITPETFAKKVKELEQEGLEIEILGEKEMKKLGMNALLAVGQGSVQESKLAIMRWMGGKKKDKPLAFIGKGVTFDTGGISIKPADGMDQMKWDMGGAGIVTGLMKGLAARKAKVNAVGIVGLVENMPSGTAQRPGDVVKSLSGQTVEVLNTDAEGRLVLADALWYAKETYDPALMIDLATLTGAIIVSLGHEYAGLFTEDDRLAKQLTEAGELVGDKVWRMPLHKAYDKLIDTPTADMKNIGGKGAGSITAAQFLKRFTGDVPWAHIDVAGVVWSDKDGDTYEKGATGFGVRLLDRFVALNYDSKNS